ncbi:unnamed protein product [Adineta steineri]|uniref:Uncharacterized protein n=1 Tax=Adineta steineri TaxID=433720 RepID=A0A813U5D7_9BILA|nr:unnamed protein product [Adineta steineri]
MNHGFFLTKRAALMDAHQRLIIGEIIEAEATKMVKRTTLELNGKSTNTVHIDCDCILNNNTYMFYINHISICS